MKHQFRAQSCLSFPPVKLATMLCARERGSAELHTVKKTCEEIEKLATEAKKGIELIELFERRESRAHWHELEFYLCYCRGKPKRTDSLLGVNAHTLETFDLPSSSN